MLRTIFSRLIREFHPEMLLPSLSAGLIAGIIIVMVQISLAALIFSGELTQFISGVDFSTYCEIPFGSGRETAHQLLQRVSDRRTDAGSQRKHKEQ